MPKLSSAVLVLVFAAVSAFAQHPPQPVTETKPVDFEWGVKIPMRDGVRLNATVYRPKDMKQPLPVIFTLTPYIGDSYHERAYYFAQNGYVFALIDVRGRGNSEGEFQPFDDSRDGHDTVEWLGRQPWSNGKVAMWGGSYAGQDQWATAREFPPHLATIVPAAAAFAGIDFPFSKNIFYSYDMQWLSFTSGRTPNNALFGETSFWISKFRDMYLNHRPYQELDRIVGNSSTRFQQWLAHPAQDAYWDSLAPSDDQFRRIDLPILTITGHYDGDQPGAMEHYSRHMRLGSEHARAQHYLIIGPWDHAGTRTPRAEFGGMKFGPASVLDMNKLHREWYDWTMKDGAKPSFLKQRVAYYVTGAEEWKYADSLEAIPAAPRKLYLNSENGRANDVFQSGTLSEELPRQSAPDKYVYDPLDVRSAYLQEKDIPNDITDQTGALNLFGNGVVYHTAPFQDATEITGRVKLAAWIAMDVPDTDFVVDLYEIKNDGSSIRLASDLMRARYRESQRQEKLVKPGEINEYRFTTFNFFSRRIAKGSRLRLVLASPNSIYMEKNYNSGGAVAQQTAKDARTAHIAIYHDANHPSYLELPIGR